MADESISKATPQFTTAEYAAKPGTNSCKSCNQPISGQYYRVSGALTCSTCAEQAERRLPKDSHQAYVRGIVFGIGGAVLGLILYATVGILTGLVIGYVSLAVGYIVGKAIKLGSRGMGGRRYQIAAALLTYAAVSMAAIPIAIGQYAKQDAKTRPAAQAQTQQENNPPPSDPLASTTNQTAAKPPTRIGAMLFGLALLGLASPFLDLQNPIQGLIGLVILFVGIRITWQITAGTAIEIIGPFNSPRAPAAPEETGAA